MSVVAIIVIVVVLRGMADHELIDEHERERFAGTSAVPDSDSGEKR